MKKKSIMALLIAVFFLPGVIAWWFLYYSDHVVSGDKSNYGMLIHPARPVANQLLRQTGSETAIQRNLHKRWSLVFKLPEECLEKCRAALHMLFQVEQLMGKNSLRLQRIALADVLPEEDAQQPRLWLFSDPKAVEGVLGELSSPARIYLIDPQGNLMMHYPMDFDPRAMLKDLRKLFKASRIG
ncbi:MAG: SCO family protein [Candidatus Eutrophobiaceae bacterium]